MKLIGLIFIASLAQFATDIYLPSLPAIAEGFGVDMDSSQKTIAVYMLALTLTQLFWGPLSDSIGRKKALFWGLLVSFVGTVLCIKANSLEFLILGRFIQGVGNGAAAGLFRAILRDMYTGAQLASVASYFSNFLVFILMVAPVLGGAFQEYFSWKASFVFLAFYTFLCLFSLKLIFSGDQKKKLAQKKVNWVKAYKRLLGSRIFMICCLSNFLTYGGMFAWITASSSLLVSQLGMSPLNFGFWSGVTGIGLMLGAFFNGTYVKKFGLRKMLALGWSLIIISGLGLILCSLLDGSIIPGIFLSAFVFYLGSSFIFANTNAIAFTPFGDIAGTASGLYAFIQYGGGAAMSYLVASNGQESPLLLGALFLGSGLSAAFAFFSFQSS